MAEVQRADLAYAYSEMEQVSDVLFIIESVCDADILALNGALRSAMTTLARLGVQKVESVQADLNKASGGKLG